MPNDLQHADGSPHREGVHKRTSIATTPDNRIAFQKVISNIKRTGRAFLQHGYSFHDVSWEDCDRDRKSALGSNISDWTLETPHGKCPVLRHRNFTDRTLTMRAKDVAIVVNGGKKVAHFQHFLEHFGSFAGAGMPPEVDLSLSADDEVTVRFVAVIVPEGDDGCCEVVPTCYNYQTNDSRDPKNFIGISFHEGVGVRTDGAEKERVYLVKHDETTGRSENTWLKIARPDSTAPDGSGGGAVLGTRSTGVGKNRVMCFQVPRQQDSGEGQHEDAVSIVPKGGGGPRLVPAIVKHGTSAGKHTISKLRTYRREPGSIPTRTFAHYFTTQDGIRATRSLSRIDLITPS